MPPNLQEGPELSEGRTFWLRASTDESIRCNAWWKNKAPHQESEGKRSWQRQPPDESSRRLETAAQAAPLTPSTHTVRALILGDGCLTGAVWSRQPDRPHTSHGLGPKLRRLQRLRLGRPESESLRDGPFSGFRPSSNATRGNSAAAATSGMVAANDEDFRLKYRTIQCFSHFLSSI